MPVMVRSSAAGAETFGPARLRRISNPQNLLKRRVAMFIEIHAIQNFAPSNLNRDDTGSPKDCEFGGHRRARVSSQCLKRAVREAFRRDQLLPKDRLARRTKRFVEEAVKRL